MSRRCLIKAVWSALLCVTLAGCGWAQRAVDATRETARDAFIRPVTTLHLDITARTALNTHSQDMLGLSVPTLVRVYQLSDPDLLLRASYEQLLDNADLALGASVLEQHARVIRPEQGVRLDVPLDSAATHVAVVALLQEPQASAGQWRLVLERKALQRNVPRVVELAGQRLTLRPLEP
ncbi:MULTISPECIES: type VI secretion system lipoprotein TssJ [unclassified Pseudomonas]|uniref:type VI secretion system lipoprotein TssJ n=1 Tax=unclassified Pseudomonas TaxID=196821 RepID=UPI000BCAB992|nr:MULTISPECIES: type VI secretion system lipoprotein TssJ [unclassified Pseudomonas]PVZ19637.1 type VI secretion system protein VasD [Pseudomonas sp. URIL14HWK12:I12]PVZ22778.1 type VI secretion system protein VasD [Pseudomonas sp. URIL14HWK12:I10]PVZ37592.1 type VI secretion system protein VasD [Pseudomonas sp. URIL14HWK12:I11]SNZ15205.1 type VI secretion system protein VasD [Pseudomonas sp. URIL14HWK12:I9]